MPLISRRWFVLGSAAALTAARFSAPKDTALSEGNLGGEWGTTTRRIARYWFGFSESHGHGELQMFVGNTEIALHSTGGGWSFIWVAVRGEEIIVPPDTPIVWQVTPDLGAEAQLGILWRTDRDHLYSENIRWRSGQSPERDEYLLPLERGLPLIRNAG